MANKPRILVCGGRDFNDYSVVRNALDRIVVDRGWITPKDKYGNFLPHVTIIHGGASGADDCADQWAVVNWCGLEIFRADWETHGKSAGPIRNQRMIDDGKPDMVVAFPGGRGTADMVRRAERSGIQVIRP